jgi:hypothetical protein
MECFYTCSGQILFRLETEYVGSGQILFRLETEYVDVRLVGSCFVYTEAWL